MVSLFSRMGGGSSTGKKMVESAQSGKAWVAANIAQKQEERADAKLDARAKNVELDEEIVAAKQSLRGAGDALEALKLLYITWSLHTTDVLVFPNISIWARSANFLGGDAVWKQLQTNAAQMAELTRLQLNCRKEETKSFVGLLKAAKEFEVAGVKL